MRIGVLLPTHDYGSSWFTYDLAGLFGHTTRTRPDLELLRFQCTGTWLPQVRHRTVVAALKADCEWLLFLDSDMRFPKDTVLQMVARQVDVVAANYTARQEPFWPTAVAPNGERIYTDYDATGLQEARTVGLGVVLVRAGLVKSIAPPWFMLGWTGTDYSGEDFYFCQKLRDAGATIWIDHDLSHDVTHVGVIEFEQSHAVKMRHTLAATEE